MKRFLLAGALAGVSLLLLAGPAMADISLMFEPMSQTVGVGSSVDVAIGISGLGDLAAPSLGTFDIDIGFDPLILGFNNVTFGDPILGDQLDLVGFGSVTDFAETSPGTLSVFELSLDAPGDLDTLQAGSFTLATLTFDALSLGTSPLAFSAVVLGDAWGDPLAATAGSASVSVVPAPVAVLLAALGLGMVGLLKRWLA